MPSDLSGQQGTHRMTRPDHTERAALEAQIAADDNVPVEYEDQAYVEGVRDLARMIRESKSANWLAVAAVLDDCARLIERAALPLAPLAPRVMEEREIEALAAEVAIEVYQKRDGQDAIKDIRAGNGKPWAAYQAADAAIRATLSRVPVAPGPGEDELRAENAALRNALVSIANRINVEGSPWHDAQMSLDKIVTSVKMECRAALRISPSAGEQGQ
jgi:hypothetical protein